VEQIVVSIVIVGDLIGARGGLVARGTMLQAAVVAGSIPDKITAFFSIYLILPAALWPWGRLSL
jgi:hypothetical protein